MDFDFEHIAVPFRMQPGLKRLQPSARHLTALSADSPLWQEKLKVREAGLSRHAVPGFDPGPALAAIAAAARPDISWAGDATSPLELSFEEDFAVLDGATGTLPWLCICVPSHWAPEDKVGLDFRTLHGPVADNAVLIAASEQLVRLATGGEHWERHVWTITPSEKYDQHPRRRPRTPWPDTHDVDTFAASCFFRAERQTFLPVGQGTRQAVFTIRVMIGPLAQAVDSPAKALRLHASLASMTDAVLAYKNLTAAREPLLKWLESRS
jgi:hypothetical protein